MSSRGQVRATDRVHAQNRISFVISIIRFFVIVSGNLYTKRALFGAFAKLFDAEQHGWIVVGSYK